MADLLQPQVVAQIGEVITQGSYWLHLYVGSSSSTVGDLLTAAHFLTQEKGEYHLSDLTKLQEQSASQIAQNFVFAVLDALAQLDLPLITLPGGGVYVVKETAANVSNYGLRLVTELPLTSKQSDTGQNTNNQTGAQKPAPEVSFCLGTWLNGEDATTNWVQRSAPSSPLAALKPGLSVFALQRDAGGALSFAPQFALVSAGINVAGGQNTALFNMSGYTLNGAEVRACLSYDGTSWHYGFAARLDDLGLPLGPSFTQRVQGSQPNPVAQNLLASPSGGSGDQSAVNPAFSISAAYMQSGTFVVQLYDKDGNPKPVVVFPVQRSLGPLHCNKLGVGWVQDNDKLSLLFDGSVELAGLTVDLAGLSIGIPVTSPLDFSQYDLDLQGLGMLLNAGAVELSAALIKVPPEVSGKTYVQYDGEALLKAGNFVISAVGSYAYVKTPSDNSGFTSTPNDNNGFTSLFIFGVYDGDLGGPSFFFITGLAAGFGYNRALLLPDQNSVAQFPLVAGLSDPTQAFGNPPDPATALQTLGKDVPPQRGEYWLAAGVRFTSFDLIHSTALLVVEFGNELEIAVLGRSWISLPPPPAPERYAYAELGIEIKLLPSQGFLSATAVLTPNSFVLDPACKLTGGFAFYAWFGDNPHAGEFVLTLGGYHPSFQPPSYYPQVPRLGFNWPMPGDVTISGDAYFALTPSAVMAGGGLQVLFSRGDLHAWFIAEMNALIVWAPFHYEVGIAVSIGVSYRLKLVFVTVTVKAELGASLQVWGPPMGGTVYISWYVISFSISFGEAPQDQAETLDWKSFADMLLPPASQSSTSEARASQAEAAAPADSNDPTETGNIYSITVNDGLLKTFKNDKGETVWVVRPNHFTFSTVTVIPTTQVNITPITPAPNEAAGVQTSYQPQDAYIVYVRPMKATLESSVFTITLYDDLNQNQVYDLAGKFTCEPACQSVPAAKWGKPLARGKDPEQNALLPNRLLGLQNFKPKEPDLTPSGTNALNISLATAFNYDTVDEGKVPPLPLQTNAKPVGPIPQAAPDALVQIQQGLMSDKVVTARNAVFTALQEYGVAPATNGALKKLAANPGAVFSGAPLIATASA